MKHRIQSLRNQSNFTVESLEDRRMMTLVGYDWIPSFVQSSQALEDGGAQPLQVSGVDVLSVGAAETGSVEIRDGAVIYTPSKDFRGVDTFELSYRDYSGETHTELHYVNVVESVFAIPDWQRIQPGSETQLDLVSNDYFMPASGDSFEEPEVTSIGEAQFGTVELLSDGSVVYRPNEGFEGVDRFKYTIVDLYGNESTGTASVEVTAGFDSKFYTNVEHLFVDRLSDAVQKNRYQFGGPNAPYGFGPIVAEGAEILLPQIVSVDFARASLTSDTDQVQGVDEADIVELMGDRLYVANGDTLRIIDVSDAKNPQLIESVTFDNPIVALYGFEDRMTVISEPVSAYRTGFADMFFVDMSTALPHGTDQREFSVHVLDVGGETAELVSKSSVDGDYRDSRFIDGTLYVVAHQGRWAELEGPANNERFKETIGDYVERVTSTQLQLPSVSTGESTQALFELSDMEIGDSNIGSIITFDTANSSGMPEDVDLIASLGGNFDIYVSTDAIYVIDSVSFFVTGRERFLNSEDLGTTKIHKFEFLDSNLGVDFSASGHVTGNLSDQFSADEHKGYFRIATTSFNSEVSLFVMEQDGKTLNIVGKIEDIAPGERIYSTRFEGDRGFVTTYRKVDPLFVIDLSDPTDPTIEGALKIPSYSNYMQVIGANHILGIGRDANDGLYDGLQVSLFNVEDPSDPQLVGKFVFEGGRNTWSPIANAWNLLDHRALTYVAETGTLALPIYTSSHWGGGGLEGEDNALSVLHVDIENETVELIGQMDFDSRVQRSVDVDGLLYGVSGSRIQVADWQSPEDLLASLNFDGSLEIPIDDIEESETGITIASIDPEDVNGDGAVNPADVLKLINMAHREDFGSMSDRTDPGLDVNNDGVFSPLDVLAVVNRLNRDKLSEPTANELGAEGSQQNVTTDAVFASMAEERSDEEEQETRSPMDLILEA